MKSCFVAGRSDNLAALVKYFIKHLNAGNVVGDDALDINISVNLRRYIYTA